MRTALVLAFVVAIGTQASGDDKVDDAKLIGKWKSELNRNETTEFTKDGKIRIVADVKGKELKIEGTYKRKGDKISVSIDIGAKTVESTVTIRKLNDEELVTVNEGGTRTTLKKVK
jgi:uncharacterized protein (TIGR03066 family)